MTRGGWSVSQEMKLYDHGRMECFQEMKQYDHGRMECFTGDETI